MTLQSTIYNTAAGSLADYDAATLTAAPTDHDYAYDPAHDSVVLAASIIGAATWTVTATWDPATRRLTAAPGQHALDLTGTDGCNGIAFLTPSGDPVCWLPFGGIFDGEGTVTLPGPDDAIAALAPGDTFVAAISDHETRIAALEAGGGGGSGLPEPIPGAAGHPLVSDGGGAAGWAPDTLADMIAAATQPGPWTPLVLSPAADPGVSAGWSVFPPGVGGPPPLAIRRTAAGEAQVRGGAMWLDASGDPASPPAGNPSLGGLLTIAEIPAGFEPSDDGYPAMIEGMASAIDGSPPELLAASIGDFGGGEVIATVTDGAGRPLVIFTTGTWETA